MQAQVLDFKTGETLVKADRINEYDEYECDCGSVSFNIVERVTIVCEFCGKITGVLV